MKKSFGGFVLLASVMALAPSLCFCQGIHLAAEKKALLAIVMADKTSDGVRQSARTLADYLERISGARFTIVTGDGTTGLALGRAEDFSALPYRKLWDGQDPTRREDYRLRSHARGLHLIGATDQAVEHAVFGQLLDGAGARVFTFTNKPGYFSVPVSSGQDGNLWKFQQRS